VSKGPPTVAVPSVIGQNRDAAISTLANAGLNPKAYPVPSSKPVDTVTGQDPPAGKVVEKGSSVRINYSSGPAEVDVPNVVGMPYDQAAASLQGQGFGVKRTDVDSDQPKDTVVDQSPDRAPSGATITLSVSKGPKTSTVPDVTSQDEASAKSTLQAAGFTVQVQQQDVNDPGLVGIVLSEDPNPGTKAKQGSTVTITVGRQAAQAPPPPPATP
jgi:eukaryotic-like serine/threonine-protein kinase